MGNVSDPQALGSSEPVELSFVLASAVNVLLAFYDDAEGLVLSDDQELGSATITVTRQPYGYAGSRVEATRVPLPVCTFGAATAGVAVNASTVTGVPGAQLQAFGLGAGAGKILVTATAIVNPGTAASYRLAADTAAKP